MPMDAQQRTAQLLQSLMGRIEQLEANQRHLQQGQQRGQSSRATMRYDAVLPAAEGRIIEELSFMPSERSTGIDVITLGAGALCTPSRNSASRGPVASEGRQEGDLVQFRHNQLSFLQRLVPHRAQVEQLVKYHTESLLWSYGGYRAPSFRQEVMQFCNVHHGQVTAVGLDLQCLALLFSVLSGAIVSASQFLV